MQWTDALENINYLSVLLGTFASLVIGAVWYAPKVFGAKWSKLVGFKKKDMEDKSGMPIMMALSIVFYALVSLVLAVLHELTGGSGLGDGVLLGSILGFVFGFGPLSVAYVFARRKFELSLLDGGYIVVACAVIGAIVGHFA